MRVQFPRDCASYGLYSHNELTSSTCSWNLTFSTCMMNARSAFERKNHQNIVVVRMLWRVQTCIGLDQGRLSKHTWTETSRRKWLNKTEWRFDAIARINRANNPGQVQVRRPNRWLQRDKLRGTKTRQGSWNEVLRYIPSLQNDGFVFLHRADGCWQPYDNSRMQGFVDWVHLLKGRAHVCGPSAHWFSEPTWLQTRWW